MTGSGRGPDYLVVKKGPGATDKNSNKRTP
jgi:hypothetical protein